MPEELIDLIAPVICPFCPRVNTAISLSIYDDGSDIGALIEESAGLAVTLATYQLMKHVRDLHPEEFVSTFSRFPEDVIPEKERLLEEAGIRYLSTTAYAADGAIQTTLHNN